MAHPLSEDDFTQVALRVEGIERDLLPVLAEFGPRVRLSGPAVVAAEAGGEQDEEKEKTGRSERQLSGKLVMAQPLDGKDITNASELQGRLALLKRGRVTFVDKCRAVQSAGAVMAIVQQTDDTWPYKMTDNTHSGADINIPCLLVSQRDGDTLQAAIHKRTERGEQKEGDGLAVELLTRDRQLACPVCRDDFTAGESAITLPCSHSYHSPCITDWLKQRNLCPLCRYALPTEGKKLGEDQQVEAERKQLREAMFS